MSFVTSSSPVLEFRPIVYGSLQDGGLVYQVSYRQGLKTAGCLSHYSGDGYICILVQGPLDSSEVTYFTAL